MKKALLTILIVLISLVSRAQTPSPDPQNMKVILNQEPFYPEGEQALYSYVLYNVKYPEEAKKKYLEGEVMCSFEVLKDSTVSNVIIISGVGSGVDEEVKKVVEKLKFAPAIQNGLPMKLGVMYSFPVKAH